MVKIASTIPDVIRLHVGEPDFPTPSHIIDATSEFLQSRKIGYVPSQGLPDLRDAIAKKIRKIEGLDIDSSNIIVTIGATQAVYMATHTIVDAGDEAIVFEPGFDAFKSVVRLANATPVIVPYAIRDGFAIIDEEVLEEAVTPRTKLIIINSPNNPAGVVFLESELRKIAEMAVSNNIAVISDEVYNQIVYDGVKATSIATLPGMKDLTITVNSFSKTYAMTGFRIGYIAVQDEALVQKLCAFQEYNGICVSPLVQAAALAALNGPQDCVEIMKQEYDRRRNFLYKRLNEIRGIKVERTRGAFYSFPDLSDFGLSSKEFCNRLMKEAHVLMVPGSNFGKAGEGHARISFATSIENLDEGMRRLESFLKKI